MLIFLKKNMALVEVILHTDVLMNGMMAKELQSAEKKK